MEFLLKEINIFTVHVPMEGFILVPIQDLGKHVFPRTNEGKKNKPSSGSETWRSHGSGLQVRSPSDLGKLASGKC